MNECLDERGARNKGVSTKLWRDLARFTRVHHHHHHHHTCSSLRRFRSPAPETHFKTTWLELQPRRPAEWSAQWPCRGVCCGFWVWSAPRTPAALRHLTIRAAGSADIQDCMWTSRNLSAEELISWGFIRTSLRSSAAEPAVLHQTVS